MPPPKKAAKKAAKKAVKKTAGHHHDKHHQAKDLRRACEHMGRVAVLRQANSTLQLPNLFLVSGSYCCTCVRLALDRDSRDSNERERTRQEHIFSSHSPGASSMNTLESKRPFRAKSPDAAGVVSWVHLGDLHMTKAGEQNHLDLAEIVNEVNRAFADSVSFVFLPGDVADDGSRAAYAVVRGELDRLEVRWCAIIGDHDVHEKSFTNFKEAMSEQTHYAFTVGSTRFVAMNAFDVPEPPSFTVSNEQLKWAEDELELATNNGQTKVLLLHCYANTQRSPIWNTPGRIIARLPIGTKPSLSS
jgi:Calcineurin-like phosphoesterase